MNQSKELRIKMRGKNESIKDGKDRFDKITKLKKKSKGSTSEVVRDCIDYTYEKNYENI